MMKLLLTYILIFITAFLSAQSMDKSVIGCAGTTFANDDLSISFTIGETVVGLVTDGESVDQGFWAGSLFVEAIMELTDLDGIQVYPNPVDSELNLFTNNKKVFGITLFAVNGQRVLKQKIDSSQLEHKIDFSYVAKGMYVLRLFVEGDIKGKLFKIIKR